LDVRAFGAVGDGVTDDTAAIQRAVTASANGSLLFPSGYTFAITDDIEVASPITITGYGATVLQTVTNRAAFTINASDVAFFGLRVRGPQYASLVTSQFGLRFEASSWAARISRITIRDCRIDRWGYEGIRLKWVTDFEVTNCTIEQINYAGIMMLSAADGRITGNHIEDLPGDPNAYGLTMTRIDNDSLVTDPRTERVVVSGNTIRNVPVWNGIDTHGGADITITNNVLEDCDGPIWCVDARNAASVATWAPQRVVIANNTIRSASDTGTADVGIVITGAGTGTGAVTEYADGIVISGNVVYQHGVQSSSQSCGIQLRYTRNATVNGNVLIEPSSMGIVLVSDCLNASVVGNLIVDCWSTAQVARAIRIVDDNCTAYISGNAMRRGTKTATSVNAQGIFVSSGATGCAIQLGENDWSGSTDNTVRDDTGGVVKTFKTVSTTPYAVQPEDKVILVDASGGARTVNLPTGVEESARMLTIKKIDSSGNAVTISRVGSDLIDGATTSVLAAQWDAVTIGCNGTANWYILSIGP
jgi:polygalacturonase